MTAETLTLAKFDKYGHLLRHFVSMACHLSNHDFLLFFSVLAVVQGGGPGPKPPRLSNKQQIRKQKRKAAQATMKCAPWNDNRLVTIDPKQGPNRTLCFLLIRSLPTCWAEERFGSVIAMICVVGSLSGDADASADGRTLRSQRGSPIPLHPKVSQYTSKEHLLRQGPHPRWISDQQRLHLGL